jgi:hypothetical protein
MSHISFDLAVTVDPLGQSSSVRASFTLTNLFVSPEFVASQAYLDVASSGRKLLTLSSDLDESTAICVNGSPCLTLAYTDLNGPIFTTSNSYDKDALYAFIREDLEADFDSEEVDAFILAEQLFHQTYSYMGSEMTVCAYSKMGQSEDSSEFRVLWARPASSKYATCISYAQVLSSLDAYLKGSDLKNVKVQRLETQSHIMNYVDVSSRPVELIQVLCGLVNEHVVSSSILELDTYNVTVE